VRRAACGAGRAGSRAGGAAAGLLAARPLPERALREPAVLNQAGGFGRSSFAMTYSIAERLCE